MSGRDVGRPRTIRDRFPPPWRLEEVPDALTPAEALALARAIAQLPEIMPAP
jgi:hypothetical protein